MASRHKNSHNNSLILLGAIVLVLIACSLWSFSMSDAAPGTFQLDEAQICEELGDDLKPINIERNLPGETQQVCLWFKYSKARDGDLLEISWYLDEKLIQRENVPLSAPDGIKAFYLLKEDGSPLNTGFYSVLLTCNGREKGMENFTVAALGEDYFDRGDEFLDY